MTFLAFGNGAPDIFSAIAAIGNAKNGDAGLAFGALFGKSLKNKSFVSGYFTNLNSFGPSQSVLKPYGILVYF